MYFSEQNLLLARRGNEEAKLSVAFAIICIVDVFGVFPIIALPKAIIDCGFYGILVVGVVCSVQIYTAVLLGKCWMIAEKIDLSIKDKNRYPYSALAEMTYGSAFSNLVSFLVNVTIFCGGIPNLIVAAVAKFFLSIFILASQNLQLLGLRLSNGNLNFSSCYWIIAISLILCPVLWLGSPKDMKLLCTISVFIVIMVFFLVFCCLVSGSAEPPPSSEDAFEPEHPLWELIFISYGIISFQYDIHPSILTIQVDMQNKSKLNLAIIAAFAISLGTFSIITIIAAMKFGVSTKASILGTLPTSILLHFAAFLVALQLCLSLAISNSALFQHMEDCMNIPKVFNHRRCLLRTTLTFLAVLIAESVPRFDLVMSLIGGTLTGPLVFILPPLFYLKLLSLERRYMKQITMKTFNVAVYGTSDEIVSDGPDILLEERRRGMFGRKFEIGFCVMVVFISVLCTLTTTYVNVKNAAAFSNFSQPCIFNVSSALIDL